MDITNINLGACPLQYLSIGYVGETGARPVAFDFSDWATEYGAGVLQLLLQRPGDAEPYPVLLDLSGTTATWTPDATDTAAQGQGQAQLIYTVGGVIVKNAIFRVLIAPSLGAAGDPPEPYEDWLERLLTIAAEAQQSAIDAAGSAEAAGTSAGAAAGSAGAAAQSALDAEAAKSGAETAATTAGQSAALAGEKATQATQAAQTAAQKATDAQQSEEDARAALEAARLAADAAETFKDDAQTAAAEANQAKTDAESAAGAAAGSAAAAAAAVAGIETKGAEQITAINQAGTTQIAAVDAAGTAQVQAIEDKGEEVVASIPSDYTELVDEVSDLKSSLYDPRTGLAQKAGLLRDTAEGAVASFVPDASVENLLGLTVDIEPVQDLHGYDNPWPAGGGKNKFGPNINPSLGYYVLASGDLAQYTGWNASDYISVNPSTQYTVSMDSESGSAAKHAFYTSEKVAISDASIDSGSSTFTTPSNCSFMRFSYRTATTWIQLELGSTATEWTPYSNICPISGWDSVEVDAAGENVLVLPVYYRATTEIPEMFFIKAGTYTFTCAMSNATNWRFGMWMRDKDGNNLSDNSHRPFPYWSWYANPGYWMAGANGNITNLTITIAEDCYIRMFFVLGDTTASTVCSNQMINIGSTASEYHPYARNRYTIPIGDTVYSGTLDITGDGVTSNYELIIMDGVTKQITGKWGETQYGAALYSTGIGERSLFSGAISSVFKNANEGYVRMPLWSFRGTSGSSGTVSFVFPAGYTVEDANNWLQAQAQAGNPVQILKKRATPVSIPLAPVTVPAFPGQTNNVWADAGDVSVEFAADIKTYIDQKIAAAVAALS